STRAPRHRSRAPISKNQGQALKSPSPGQGALGINSGLKCDLQTTGLNTRQSACCLVYVVPSVDFALEVNDIFLAKVNNLDARKMV
ncbi:MAG: hypothetical protein ACK56F_08325, partial [bacterium]